MAKKGNSRHLKSINAPKYFGVGKKENAYVIKQKAGRHTFEKSVPILLFLKQMNLIRNAREAKKSIKEKPLVVNGRKVVDTDYPVGINDIININNEDYEVGINKYGKVTFTKVKNSKKIIYKIIKKYKAGKGKIFFGLHDGSVIEGSNTAKVNDSVEVGFDKKITEIIKLEKGSKCLVIDGVHTGVSGVVSGIKEGDMHISKKVIINDNEGNTFETIVKNIMVTK